MTRTTESGKVLSVLRRPRRPGEVATLRAAIRNNCLECCCGSAKDVRLCPCTGCWLWPYRHGSGLDLVEKSDSGRKSETEGGLKAPLVDEGGIRP